MRAPTQNPSETQPEPIPLAPAPEPTLLMVHTADHSSAVPSSSPTPRPEHGKRTGPSPWRKPFFASVAVALLAVIGWYAYTWFFSESNSSKPLTAIVGRGELKITITDRGELESINPIQVQCELEGGGKLVSIIPEGTPVKEGSEVAKLDTDVLMKAITEQEIKWETAESKVNTARSDLAQAKNKALSEVSKAELVLEIAEIELEAYTDPEGKFIRDQDKAKGALELARKNLKESEDDLEFTRGLVKKGFAQLDAVRTKELAVTERRLLVTSAQAELTILEKFTRKKDLTELRSKAKEAKIELARTKESQAAAVRKVEDELKSALKTSDIEKKQLERVKTQLDRCVIKAPSSGIVIYYNARYWDENARIRPGVQIYYRQPIFTLPDLSKMLVKLKVHESVIKTVKTGMTATLKIDALPNSTLNGKVLKIATLPQSDGWRGGSVKQYVTEVSIDDLPTEAGLKPGMTAEVKILVNTLPDAVHVPVQAVAEYEGKPVCYVVSGSRISRREVKSGESNEQYIHILEGLEPGEEVALDARLRAAKELKASKPKSGDGDTPATNKPEPKGGLVAAK
jgi:HlyD family secretion protein